MTLPSAHSTTRLRTVSVSSDPRTLRALSVASEPSTYRTVSVASEPSTFRTVNVASEPSTYRTVSLASEPSTYRAVSLASEPSTYRTVSVASEPSTYRAVSLASEPSTYRTVSVASEPGSATLGRLNIAGGATLRAVNVAPSQLSSMQYVNGANVDSTALQGNLRYLVPMPMPMPVQRPSEYVVVNQAPQMTQLTPVYLQNLQSVQRVNISNMDETDHLQQLNINGQASMPSQPPSPIKSPEPPEPVVSSCSSSVQEIVNVNVKNHLSSEVRTEFESDPVAKLDTRFFGELLAEVYRKNCDIHTCISDHVTRMGGRKQELDYKEKEDIELLIPKGVSELTKQQIRYLLQTRMTADKTMRMLLTTFSSLREDLVHLQDDLRRLESEKEQLERDLSFKADQALQYDRLMESVRENNRQLQLSVKESAAAQRNLESQLMSSRGNDSSKDYRLKDLESSKRALEQENELLRKRLEGQSSSSTTLHTKTQELSRHYEQMLKELREEKDKELMLMRSQLVKIQTEFTTERSSDKSLQLRIAELLSSLEQRESTIRRQEEEIRRLQKERSSSAGSLTQTVVTKRYDNQYPILGLLSDDYHYTPSPIRESKTIVIKRTGEMTKKEFTT